MEASTIVDNTEEEKKKTPQDSPSDRAPSRARSKEELRALIAHTERVLYLRTAAGVAIYLVFAVLDVSAALTGTMQERAPLLLGLLVASIFALPRQVIKRDVLLALQGSERADWLERMKRVQYWLVWVRGIFFLGALLLFLGLPEIV